MWTLRASSLLSFARCLWLRELGHASVENLKRQVRPGDVGDDGVVLVVLEMDYGSFVGFLPGDEEETVAHRLDVDCYGFGLAMTAVRPHPGVCQRPRGCEVELDPERFEVDQVAMSYGGK